jgi:molecular chaperone GrpE
MTKERYTKEQKKELLELQKKLKEKEEKISKLEVQLKESKDKLLRSYADFQNYQKRIEKEIDERIKETKDKLFIEILDLYENLTLAYKDKSPKKTLKLILKKIENLMEKEKVKPIETIGKKFDHEVHHAISVIEKDDVEDGTIVDEIKKGYFIEERVLRPSMVVVAKNSKNK